VITITKAIVLVQGTRFGTRDELQASQAHIHLKKLGVDIHIQEREWLAHVAAHAQQDLQKIGGGIVS
jgi:hypothetical protein